jgi:hypothetical protein
LRILLFDIGFRGCIKSNAIFRLPVPAACWARSNSSEDNGGGEADYRKFSKRSVLERLAAKAANRRLDLP